MEFPDLRILLEKLRKFVLDFMQLFFTETSDVLHASWTLVTVHIFMCPILHLTARKIKFPIKQTVKEM